MPQAVIERLSSAVQEATRQHNVRKRLIGMGIERMGNSPSQFAAFLARSIAC